MSPWRKNVKWYLVAFLIVANGLIWYQVSVHEKKVLTVAFLDVGQGDSIYIETPTGNQLLVDGGPPSGALLRELGKLMPFFDRSIDVVLETHPDADHIGGFSDLFDRFQISYFVEPGIENDTAPTEALFNAITREKGLVKVEARRGMVIDLGDGVWAQILFPDRDVSTIETNTGSIVIRLGYGDTRVLLTGDAPNAIESYLVSLEGKNLRSSILKLGHHGSRTSSSREFVETVSPGIAVISAGKDNRYGHPHREVLEILGALRVAYVSTAELGTIRFESDGTVFRQK